MSAIGIVFNALVDALYIVKVHKEYESTFCQALLDLRHQDGYPAGPCVPTNHEIYRRCGSVSSRCSCCCVWTSPESSKRGAPDYYEVPGAAQVDPLEITHE